MPSRSPRQARLMRAVCKGGVKVKGLSKQVACKFVAKDKKRAGRRK